jgi:hypothetical protein
MQDDQSLRHRAGRLAHQRALAVERLLGLPHLLVALADRGDVHVAEQKLVAGKPRAGYQDDTPLRAAHLDRRLFAILRQVADALGIDLVERLVAAGINAVIEIDLQEIAVQPSDQFELLAGIPEPVEGLVDVFEGKIAVEDTDAHRDRMQDGLHVLPQLFGVLHRLLVGRDIGDGADEMGIPLVVDDPHLPGNDRNDAPIGEGLVFRLLDRFALGEDAVVLNLAAFRLPREHLGVGPADEVLPLVTEHLLIGGIDEFEALPAVAHEHGDRQVLQYGAQDLRLADIPAKMKLLLLEIADIRAKRDDETVVETLVDTLQPTAVRQVLDRLGIGKREGLQPLLYPGGALRRLPVGEPRAVAHAFVVDLFADRAEAHARRQLDAEGIEELDQLRIVVNESAVAVVDTDADVEKVESILQLQVPMPGRAILVHVPSSDLGLGGLPIMAGLLHRHEGAEQIGPVVFGDEALDGDHVADVVAGDRFLRAEDQRTAFLLPAAGIFRAAGNVPAGPARQIVREQPEQRRIGAVDGNIIECAVLDEGRLPQIIDPRARRPQELAMHLHRLLLQPPPADAAAVPLSPIRR